MNWIGPLNNGAGSVVLDAHLLESDHRLGAVLDPELAEGGCDMGLALALDGGVNPRSVVLDAHLLESDHPPGGGS